MVIEDTPLYRFSFTESDAVLDFVWKEATSEMSDDDFKRALRAFVLNAARHCARALLVDVRAFRHPLGEGIAAWRDAEISPLYNGAGIRRFAYVVPAQAPATPDGAPDPPSAGEDFATRFYHDEADARRWLRGA